MRVDNWPLILAEQVEAARLRPFAWGSWDCCQFAAETVLALTGVDYRDRFPLYQSADDAQILIAEHGGVQHLLSSVLGESKHPALAQRGDVVMGDFGDGLAAGICVGAHCCAVGQRGLVFMPMSRAVAAWSI
jgi:hypothetical protein